MNIINILKKPIITEKTYKLMEMNKYVFTVNPLANKEQIKIAFVKIFGVEVQDVNLLKSKPKKKRVGRFLGKKSGVKKAIITIKPGQKFNILQDDLNDDKTTTTANKSIFDSFKQLFSKPTNSKPKEKNKILTQQKPKGKVLNDNINENPKKK